MDVNSPSIPRAACDLPIAYRFVWRDGRSQWSDDIHQRVWLESALFSPTAVRTPAAVPVSH